MRVLGVTLALGILFFSHRRPDRRACTRRRNAARHLQPNRWDAQRRCGRISFYRGERCAGFPNPYRTVRLDRLVRILHGQCATFANPFNARYMFWWGAVAGGINAPGTVWNASGDQSFCIPNVYGATADMSSSFTFEDENVSQSACESGRANPRWVQYLGAGA